MKGSRTCHYLDMNNENTSFNKSYRNKIQNKKIYFYKAYFHLRVFRERNKFGVEIDGNSKSDRNGRRKPDGSECGTASALERRRR